MPEEVASQARTNNKLSTKESYQLIEWFRENQSTIAKQAWSRPETARRASQDLKFLVTEHNLNFAGQDEDCVFKFEWPRSIRTVRSTEEVVGRINLVTLVLAKVTSEFKFDLGHLQAEWDELVKHITG